jgi:hypothetical protein
MAGSSVSATGHIGQKPSVAFAPISADRTLRPASWERTWRPEPAPSEMGGFAAVRISALTSGSRLSLVSSENRRITSRDHFELFVE